jgi:hypothetical protein
MNLKPKHHETIYLLIAILFTGTIFAQENNPKLEAVGQLVKTTYYFENGKVQQEGFFKMEKTELGFHMTRTEINHLATYDNGVKTGKWLFWNGKKLKRGRLLTTKLLLLKLGNKMH